MTVAAIDVKTLSLHGGGISTFVRAVLPELIERTPGFDWVAFGPARALAQLPAGLRRVRVDMVEWLGPPRLPLYDQVQLRLAARRERVRLFYSPYIDAPAGLSASTVVTMHDAVHLRFPGLYPAAQRWYYGGLMRLHGAGAAAVVTDSEFSKAELVRLARVDPSRVHVVPLALPPSFVRPEQGPDGHVLRRYGVAGEYVLYTGGVEERKNLGRLLDAYALWRDRRGGQVPPLAITGAPERFARHRDDVERLGLASSIVLTGRVADADLPHLYAGAAACVYPTLYEGFGFPLLEAMTCGVPVACSRRASLPEIGGDAARYFDPESPEDMARALEDVTSNRALRAQLVEAGRRRASDFSVRATADNLARVLVEASGR